VTKKQVLYHQFQQAKVVSPVLRPRWNVLLKFKLSRLRRDERDDYVGDVTDERNENRRRREAADGRRIQKSSICETLKIIEVPTTLNF